MCKASMKKYSSPSVFCFRRIIQYNAFFSSSVVRANVYGESLGHSVVDLSSFLNVIYLSTSNFAISLSAGITIDFGEKRKKNPLEICRVSSVDIDFIRCILDL